ncbi:hypothetical protein RQP46_010418 [Phenoliferia psychrophenolica]
MAPWCLPCRISPRHVTPIHRLPTETLSHIFAHLPPIALGLAQLVCKHWREVVGDDASWRSAFEIYYGILDEGGVSLGRRLAPLSWRAEYISRVHLLTRWTKSRTPSVTHDPQLGPIAALHLVPTGPPVPRTRSSTPSSSAALLSTSSISSRSVLSAPFTGKLSRLSLPASPTDNFGAPIHPHLPLLSSDSFAVSPDAGRIVWGMSDGSFRLVDAKEESSRAGRAWAGVREDAGERIRSLDGHRRKVGAVAFDPNGAGDLWVSVGDDGAVGVWTLKDAPLAFGAVAPHPRLRPAGRRIWEASIPDQHLSAAAIRQGDGPAKGCMVAFDERGTIAVGMTDGAVHVWTDVSLLPQAAIFSPSTSGARYLLVPPTDSPVDFLALDGSHLLVHRANALSFDRVNLSLSSLPPSKTTFGHKPDHLGAITAFALDFTTPLPLPTTSSSKLPLPPTLRFESHASRSTTPPLHPSASVDSIDSLATPSSLPAEDESLAQGANAFGQRKYVVAGDVQGRVFVWDWEAEATGELIEPRRSVQGFQSKVTALAVSDAAIFVGCLDGSLRVYDTLTSTLLRTFKDRAASRLPARMLAQGLIDDEDRWRVSAILASRDSVIAAIGGRVLAWRIEEVEIKKRLKGKGASGKMSARAEHELRLEVRESLTTLSSEASTRLSHLRNDRRVATEFGLPPDLDNMTEAEAIEFAMMLSVDEQEQSWLSGLSSARASPSFGPVPEEELDMDGLDLGDGVGAGGAPRQERTFGNRRAREVSIDETSDDEEEEDGHSTGSYSRSLSMLA